MAASTLQIEREAEVGERVDHVGVDALAADEVGAAGVGVEQHVELVGGAIADADDDVGVHHVVDQRDVLVADALDVVLAEAVLQHRRALERLDGDGRGCRSAP